MRPLPPQRVVLFTPNLPAHEQGVVRFARVPRTAGAGRVVLFRDGQAVAELAGPLRANVGDSPGVPATLAGLECPG